MDISQERGFLGPERKIHDKAGEEVQNTKKSKSIKTECMELLLIVTTHTHISRTRRASPGPLVMVVRTN